MMVGRLLVLLTMVTRLIFTLIVPNLDQIGKDKTALYASVLQREMCEHEIATLHYISQNIFRKLAKHNQPAMLIYKMKWLVLEMEGNEPQRVRCLLSWCLLPLGGFPPPLHPQHLALRHC